MKKSAPWVILLLAVLLVSAVFMYWSGTVIDLDGDRIDGPAGALLGALFAGGGLLFAGFVMVVVGLVLAVVFAGVGVLLLGGLALGAFALAAAISPLLLPLLVPLAIIWFFVSRSRKQRALREQAV
ncbi:hypothetical protein GCM10027321_35590 [Massilia terrae]|uniref:Transmembrane protein n=1 Tax=Massilia terrae TaxID=1811224 RepID=A0ABT2D436_9BURK|nr:hypothetical protein [Massilia terrae]MCS0660997.1 hypothetical protein [Massilia terrae]